MTFDERIAALIYDTAQEILVPASQRVDTLTIEEKGPNDFVTETDKAMEAALTERLTEALPGSLVLGEEAAAAEPGLIARLLQTDKPLWIVDPLDGTANFINRSGGFGPIVALAENGAIKGGWIYDTTEDHPVYHMGMLDQLVTPPVREGKPRGYIGGRIQKMLNAMDFDFTHAFQPSGASMSCTAYSGMLRGEIDFVLYGMTQPWDHFAGCEMLKRQGMFAKQWTGDDVTYTGRNNGLLLARNEEIASIVMNMVVTPVIKHKGLPYDEHDVFRYAAI